MPPIKQKMQHIQNPISDDEDDLPLSHSMYQNQMNPLPTNNAANDSDTSFLANDKSFKIKQVYIK